MRRGQRLLIGMLGFLLCSPAMANLYCTGTIERIRVSKNGEVWIVGSWRTDGSYTMVCDLDTTWKDISAGDCEKWYPLLHGAVHANTTVTLYYPLGGTCMDLATNWDSPSPHYVVLEN